MHASYEAQLLATISSLRAAVQSAAEGEVGAMADRDRYPIHVRYIGDATPWSVLAPVKGRQP